MCLLPGICVGLEDKGKGFRYLDQAVDEHRLIYLAVEPNRRPIAFGPAFPEIAGARASGQRQAVVDTQRFLAPGLKTPHERGVLRL